jgi:excisionase family DNA binding protein
MGPNGPDSARLLTDQQAADRLGISARRVREFRYEGSLPTVDLGYRSKRIPSEAVDRLVRERTTIERA